MSKNICCGFRDTKSFFYLLKEKSLTFERDFICKIDSVLYKQCLNSLVINNAC